MKKKLVLLALVLSVIFVVGATYSFQGTLIERYSILRAEASEDTALAITTAGAFASKPTSAVGLSVTPGGVTTSNALQITIIGGDAANDTFSWRLYAWRKGNGPAELVANGTGILGTQQVVTYPQGGTATDKYWADSLTITAQYWLTTISVSTTGGNSVASLWFDAGGYRWFYIEITDADGTGTEAESLTVYYSSF